MFEIRDYATNDICLLLSPALADSVKSRPESYLTLLFTNGSCLQTIGPLHYYQGLASMDFHYYAKLLRPDLYQQSGLSAVMTDTPEDFVILDVFTEIPSIGHKGKRLFSCSSTFVATSLDQSALSSSFDIEDAQGKMRFRLEGNNPPFATADLYWDPSKQEAFIYTKNKEDYDRIALALKSQLEAPPEPQVFATQIMEIAARELLGVEPPVIAWEKAFEPPPDSPEVEEAINHINALLQDLADATNHGRAYDLQKLAARHGVPMEETRQAEQALTRQAESMAINVPGGLPGAPALPPSGRMKMQEELAKCELFLFSRDDTAQRLFQDLAARIGGMRPRERVSRTRTMLTLATLPSIVEEIDDPPWDEARHTVLKYSMYLLCRARG